MERFDRQKAVDFMNEAHKKDEKLQAALDQIYLEIEKQARHGYGRMTYGPLDFTLVVNVAAFLEEKEFVTIMCCMPGNKYKLEVIWEEGY